MEWPLPRKWAGCFKGFHYISSGALSAPPIEWNEYTHTVAAFLLTKIFGTLPCKIHMAVQKA